MYAYKQIGQFASACSLGCVVHTDSYIYKYIYPCKRVICAQKAKRALGLISDFSVNDCLRCLQFSGRQKRRRHTRTHICMFLCMYIQTTHTQGVVANCIHI